MKSQAPLSFNKKKNLTSKVTNLYNIVLSMYENYAKHINLLVIVSIITALLSTFGSGWLLILIVSKTKTW